MPYEERETFRQDRQDIQSTDTAHCATLSPTISELIIITKSIFFVIYHSVHDESFSKKTAKVRLQL